MATHGRPSNLDSRRSHGITPSSPRTSTTTHVVHIALGALAVIGVSLGLGLGACGDDPIPDTDRDGVLDPGDCAPNNPDIRPGAWERCDGLDNDCDGLIDELYDLDDDGFLADDAGCRALGGPVDCNDLDPTIHPDAEELDDNLDNDCDGQVDDSPDLDNDGYGVFEDCDDSDPYVHPGAAEICDGVDNDCDGVIDPQWDSDGDGASICGGDCDDNDPANGSHLPEVCDGQDNDCDGASDEGFDMDGDGYTVCRGDCDDTDPATAPGRVEICGDGVDNDCDPATSETADIDNDGFTFCSGDCDDNNGGVYPGAPESCDGVDNDCNGFADDPIACWNCTTAGNYIVCTDQIPFAAALATCQAFGGDAVIITDATENNNVATIAWNVQPGSYWIGLSDQAQEGIWRWVDGTLATFTSWAAGEPNNSGNEDCVHTNFNNLGRWNDLPCSAVQPFICEMP